MYLRRLIEGLQYEQPAMDMEQIVREWACNRNSEQVVKFRLPYGREKFMARVRLSSDDSQYNRDGEGMICVKELWNETGEELDPKVYPLAYKDERLNVIWDFDVTTEAGDELVKYLAKFVRLIPEEMRTLEGYLEEQNKEAIKLIQRDIYENERDLERALQRYKEAARQRDDLLVKLEGRLKGVEVRDKKARAEQLRGYLHGHRKIHKWEFIPGGGLKLWTKDIVLEYEGERWKAPNYLVELRLVNGRFTVKGEDGEQPIHPHVFDSGTPCYGNYIDMLPNVIATGDIKQLVEMVIIWLNTYNNESPNISWDTLMTDYNDY